MALHFEVSQNLRVPNLSVLQDKVRLNGGRLIVYAEVISAIVLSARSYRVVRVASEAERRSGGLLSNVITGLLGWWALWGAYRAIAALVFNLRGGVDVTEALMRAHPGNSSLLGYDDGVALQTAYERACRLSLWICLGIIAAFIGLVFLLAR